MFYIDIYKPVMRIAFTLFKQSNFEATMVSNLKSYFEQQEQLKDIIKEDKLIYGGKEAGKLGQAVCTWSC